jgi:hypothetical protein
MAVNDFVDDPEHMVKDATGATHQETRQNEIVFKTEWGTGPSGANLCIDCMGSWQHLKDVWPTMTQSGWQYNKYTFLPSDPATGGVVMAAMSGNNDLNSWYSTAGEGTAFYRSTYDVLL